MALIWRELPGWPLYKDADGHSWKLAPNGYWWLYLHSTNFWYQAGSQAAGDVLGIAVPAYNPAAFTSPIGETSERLTRCLQQSNLMLPVIHDLPYMYSGGSGGGGGSYSAALKKVTRTNEAPNIPPDFLPIPLAEDCCTECHLDDGPLYEGDRCRYCWMLAQLPAIPEAQPPPQPESPESVLGRRQTLRIAAAGVTAIIAMWAAAWLIVYLVAYL